MKIKLHYGWFVCFACTITIFFCSGCATQAFSVYTPYLVEKLSLTQTQASMIVSFRSLSSLVMQFVILWVIDKIGVRYTMALGLIATALAFSLFAVGNTVAQMYIAAAVLGIGYSFGAMVPISIMLHRWFHKKLAMAVAVCTSSTGVSSIICPTIITKVVEEQSLSAAFGGEAAIVLALGAIAVAVMRNRPEDLGLRPYGSEDMPAEGEQSASIDLKTEETELLSEPIALLMLLPPALAGAITMTTTGIFSLHFVGQGFDAMEAAAALSIFGFALLVGKLIYGLLSDVLGDRYSNYLILSIWLLGAVLCAFIRNSHIVLYLSVGLMGVGISESTVGMAMWARDFSPPSKYDRTVRRNQILFVIGAFLFSPITGAIADWLGSYVPVFLIYGMMIAVMLLIIALAYKDVEHRTKEEGI